MRANTLLIAAGTLAIAGAATADFLGATAVDMGDLGGGVSTWQVFMNFDSPGDRLLAVGGINGMADLRYQSLDAGGNLSGEALVNAGGAFLGSKQEDFAQFPISMAHDSWVTIGSTGFAGNATDYSPGFAGGDGIASVIEGSSWGHYSTSSLEDGGYFNGDPGNDAGLAGVDGAVLVAQFTVSYFEYSGTISYSGSAGATDALFHVLAIAIPAPGAFAMLGLAGLAARRRRRG